MEKTRISIVSYLNSKPFLYGLEHSAIHKKIEISRDIPSKVASKLSHNLTDIGLIPVAALEDLDEFYLLSSYCIGSNDKVKTVVLASHSPIEDINTVLMDYQSRTSVQLAKVLAKFYWKKEFNWEPTCAGFENHSIEGDTAGVIIGDRVFESEKKFPYIYDLSLEWNNFTGLPFVFAVWAANKKIDPAFEDELNKAFKFGISQVEKVILEEKDKFPGTDLESYFTKNISFDFDDAKRGALKKFLELVRKLEPIEHC